MHCLQAVLPRKPPARMEARTHLQLGSVLYHHTRNGEQARGHLEKAVSAGAAGGGRARVGRAVRCADRRVLLQWLISQQVSFPARPKSSRRRPGAGTGSESEFLTYSWGSGPLS